MKVDIIIGKNLPSGLASKIDVIWKSHFQESWDSISPEWTRYKGLDNPEAYANDTFFIITDEERILAAGRLRPIELDFLETTYFILGVADIVAVEKGKGYGRALIEAVHARLIETEMTGVGFCRPSKSPFYEKMGFNIAKDLVERFVYKEFIGVGHSEDVLYVNGKDRFMEQVLAHPDEIVHIPVPNW